jgi:carbamoyltransferase
MIILGIHGGYSLDSEDDFDGHSFHDAAAVLLRDGDVVAAIEEERLARVKHINCFPRRAISFCLNTGGCTLKDVNYVAVNMGRHVADGYAKVSYLEATRGVQAPDGRARMNCLFRRAFGEDIGDKLEFCSHHVAHAWSAFLASSFSRSLIYSVDGDGDNCSGMILIGNETTIDKVRDFSIPQSLGHFYEDMIRVLGYSRFDEYKVMGLAPYGDEKVYEPTLSACYKLMPDGDYAIEDRLVRYALLDSAGLIKRARRVGSEIQQHHKDFAAGLQKALERIVFHVLSHYQKLTNVTHLCMAGGVAHNCTMNGKILYSNLFSDVYVQPAAHDAGGALGAAWYVHHRHSNLAKRTRISHLYWGSDIGGSDRVVQCLTRWRHFVAAKSKPDVTEVGAQILAEGRVLGWAQGRSEFGPRALGNRSILADPRPAANKDVINSMVKKREAFRPFAPAVLEECAAEFFELPRGLVSFPFMIFVLKVRASARSLLGAVTHVDGTARVQTVSKETNPVFWQLIYDFGKLTGTPILLNTSFNNRAEPIVDSVDDAVTCYLTTGIQSLIVGDFLVTKCSDYEIVKNVVSLVPQIPACRTLIKRGIDISPIGVRQQGAFEVSSTRSDVLLPSVEISHSLYALLGKADGKRRVGEILDELQLSVSQRDVLISEVFDLWQKRCISMSPDCLPLPLSKTARTATTAFERSTV